MTGRAEPSQSALRSAATEPAYERFKPDGWPLCPGCDEDELWSAEIPATVETIVSCLRCGWRPGYYQITVEGREDRSAS